MFGRPLFIIWYASSKAYYTAQILFSYLYNHTTKKKVLDLKCVLYYCLHLLFRTYFASAKSNEFRSRCPYKRKQNLIMHQKWRAIFQ